MTGEATLAAPQEFDEAAAVETKPARRGRSVKPEVLDDGALAGIRVCDASPTKVVTIPATAGKTRQVEVVDKEALWSLPYPDLRARWHDVTVRPVSGRVHVYDKAGALVARLENWTQAAALFAKAEILDAVTSRLDKAKAVRLQGEAQARAKLEATRRG